MHPGVGNAQEKEAHLNTSHHSTFPPIKLFVKLVIGVLSSVLEFKSTYMRLELGNCRKSFSLQVYILLPPDSPAETRNASDLRRLLHSSVRKDLPGAAFRI